MNALDSILKTHPHTDERLRSARAHAAQALNDCAEICSVCADACLWEKDPAMLRRCIIFNLECADACRFASRSIIRLDEGAGTLLRPIVHACLTAIQLCRDECDSHAHHHHCRICAESCGEAMRVCNEFLGLINDTGVGTTPSLARDV